MRIYLDNCCYSRPFDEQAQLLVRLETEAKLRIQAMMRSGEIEYVWSSCWRSKRMRIEDSDLCVKGLSVLIENLGNVEAERFVCLMNQGAGDYTQWRRNHLFVGETVHSLAEKARQTGDMLRALEPAQS